MLAEQQTEWIINNNLVNKGWRIDSNNNKNVYFQKPKLTEQKDKLKGKRPDYILYKSNTDIPIAIIEAKKGGVDLKLALEQATEYAKVLDVSLVFAMNGAYCEARFVPNNKELILNGEEVRELLREKEILAFLQANSNEAWTIPKEVKVSRDELISIFKNLNTILRSEGLRAGIERFSEFANILFLKLLSENNEKSWWNTIKAQSNDDIIGYINSYVIEQITNKYGGDVFTPISISNPQTLRHIIDAIDPLILSTIDSDIKGDAFEYFLEKTTSTENDLGEYFTPRNVVKTIINIVDPKFKETIYDPFCGTGGFLTEAFNYIKENTIINTQEDLERLKLGTLYGREITTTARIAKMNMILHGDGHSGVQQINSLENPDYIQPITNQPLKFDVIITNMPFSQEIIKKTLKNGKTITENHISYLYYNGIAKNNGDAACVLHCLNNLKEGGRMALVVPEGFLFRKDVANVRQFLLSKARLQAVISLPQGTFLPYTGVKTDILYFTDAHKPNRQKYYWFYEAKNIGVTLGNRKRKIAGINDLNKIDASDIRKIDKHPDLKANMLELGFEIVDLEKVKNNDYNLVGNGYREVTENKKSTIVELSAICHIHNGTTPSRKEQQYWDNGDIPWFTLEDLENGENIFKTKQFITKKALEETSVKLLPPKTILLSCTATIGKVALSEIPLTTNQQINGLIIKDQYKDKVLPKFLFYICKSLEQELLSISTTQTTKYISIAKLSKIKIPLPSVEEQQKIVEELDKIQQAIEYAKGLIASLKNRGGEYWLDYKNIKSFCSLEEVCIINPKKPKLKENIEVSFIDMATLPIYGYKFSHSLVKPITEVRKGYTYFEEDDILVAKITPCFENGKCGIATNLENKSGFGSTEFIVLRPKKDILVEYLYIFISSKRFIDKGKSFMTGTVGQQRISMDFVRNYKIPIIDIEEQQQIIQEVEIEYNLLKEIRNLLEKQETKLNTMLKSLLT